MHTRPVRFGRHPWAAAACAAALLLCVTMAAIHGAAPHGGQPHCKACHLLNAKYLSPTPALAAAPAAHGDPLPEERCAGRTADASHGLSPLRAPPSLPGA